MLVEKNELHWLLWIFELSSILMENPDFLLNKVFNNGQIYGKLFLLKDSIWVLKKTYCLPNIFYTDLSFFYANLPW